MEWVSQSLLALGEYHTYDNDPDLDLDLSSFSDSLLSLNMTCALNMSRQLAAWDTSTTVAGTLNNNVSQGNATRYLETPTFDDASLTKMIVFSVMFILSLFGNMATLIQMRRLRRRKNTINTLIVNLALADLLVTFFCIAGDAVWAATTQWLAGNVVCKLFKFMQAFALYLSTFITVAISLDRCVAILDPMRRNGAAQRVRFMIVSAWIFSALFSVPQIFVFNVQRGPFKVEFFQCVTFGNYMSPWQMQMYAIASLMFMFVLPLAVIGTAYTLIFTTISRKSKEHSVMDGVRMPSNKSLVTRWVSYKNYLCLTICRKGSARHNSITSSCSVEHCRGPVRSHLLRKAKRKSLRMSFVIVMAFVMCWTPYYIVYILNTFVGLTINPMGNLFLIIGLSNSLLNPVIYGAFQLCKVQFYTPSSWRRNVWRGTSPRLPHSQPNRHSDTPAGTPTSVTASQESRKRLLKPSCTCDSCHFTVKEQKVHLSLLGGKRRQHISKATGKNLHREHRDTNKRQKKRSHKLSLLPNKGGGGGGGGGVGGDGGGGADTMIADSGVGGVGGGASGSGVSGVGGGGGGNGGRCGNFTQKHITNGEAQDCYFIHSF